MAPFHGWGSIASRLQSHYEKLVCFLPLNNVFQLSHRLKSILRSKLYQITYTLEEKFFAAASFKGLSVLSFQRE